jgi:2-hydroxy-4-carboxymuconate semialdehyde hemiacetal dehydrogenase
MSGHAWGDIGVALLGYGAIADMHAAALRALDVTPLVVAGPRAGEAELFAERHGIGRATTDVDAAIAEAGVRAVIVASPSGVHVEQARASLAAGRHALVEIPLALSLADGEALVAQARDAGLVLAVCHTLRYWSPLDRAHAWLAEGGHEVKHVVARALSLRHENVGWTGRRRSWTDDLLWHHGGHVIDEVLRLLPGPVEAVEAAVGPVWPESGLPMDYAITVRTAGGAIASIALSYNARVGRSDYLVITDRDTMTIEGADVHVAAGPLVAGQSVAETQEAAVLAQDRDFLRAAATGETPIAAAEAILPVLAVQQAVADRGAR